jgi:hypothetical protein
MIGLCPQTAVNCRAGTRESGKTAGGAEMAQNKNEDVLQNDGFMPSNCSKLQGFFRFAFA